MAQLGFKVKASEFRVKGLGVLFLDFSAHQKR